MPMATLKETLGKEVSCSSCQDQGTEFKVLPCCHYYCTKCIVGKLTEKAGSGKMIPCPECYKNVALPDGGVEGLPSISFNKRTNATSSTKAHVQVLSDKCEICSDDEPEAFCKQCEQCICGDCAASHQQLKMFHGHEVTPTEKGEGKDASQGFQACTLHVEEGLKYYCYDCNNLICLACTIDEHSGHRHELIKVVVPEAKEKLVEHMKPLSMLEGDLSQAIKDVQTTKSGLVSQGDNIVEEITSSFEELYKIIKRQEQVLLGEAKTKLSKKLKRLSVQEKSLSSSCETVRRVLKLSDQCLKHSADGEIMCLHTEIQSRLQ